MKSEKYSSVDFSEHKLIIKDNSYTLKKKDTIIESITFTNICGVLLITGDFGIHTFIREFHPAKGGRVSTHYWCEKYNGDPDEYCPKATEEIIGEELRDTEEQELIEYYSKLLSVTNLSEWEYISYAYNEYKPIWVDAEDVPFGKKIKPKLLIIFDAFNEICKRLKDN